ncbi:MAG: hypothetical protein H6858_01210 [Rhodospirillales bacterium]|nr:hypothetical protein [Alphaproteobacteria bacterium]MCB1839239.1 hypothetical protein [Alphaproteobacteria bacterium]MCB9976199.1 hypothetical protein [Rhodospirillales bacterium]
MAEVLNLLLNMLIVGLLGATIFFTMRLYSSLSSFREHRDDFERVVGKLIASIAQAEQAIKNLKHAGTLEAESLEGTIREARALSEELKMVNEASGNMAKRLEDLAEKNRKIVEGFDAKSPYLGRQQKRFIDEPDQESALAASQITAAVKSAEKRQAAPPPQADVEADFPSFFIHDRDFETAPLTGTRSSQVAKMREGFVDVFDESPEWNETDDEMPIPPALQSQAERELYEALRKNKRKAANGGRN